MAHPPQRYQAPNAARQKRIPPKDTERIITKELVSSVLALPSPLQALPVQLLGDTWEMTGRWIGFPIAVLAVSTLSARALGVRSWEAVDAEAVKAVATVAVYVMLTARRLSLASTLHPSLYAEPSVS